MGERVALQVGGAVYGGWQSVTIVESLEALAAGFTLSVTERWAGQDEDWPIQRGDAVQVLAGESQVLAGHVDRVDVRLDHGNRSITVTGRDFAADLVDSSAVRRPGEWVNVALDVLVRQLAQPFGVTVSADGDLGEPIPRFVLQQGETAWSAVERACRLRGVLATGDGLGGITLARAGRAAYHAGAVREGEHLLGGSASFDEEGRFRTYIVRSQQPEVLVNWDPALANVQGTAEDLGARAARQTLLLAEGSLSRRGARERAEWEAAVRRARAVTAEIQVQGWRDAAGRLWRKRTSVDVSSPALRLDHRLLVREVRRTLGEDGTRTTLGLVRADVYTPRPRQPDDRFDPWTAGMAGGA